MSDTEIRKLSPYKQIGTKLLRTGVTGRHNQPAPPITATLQAKLDPTVDLRPV